MRRRAVLLWVPLLLATAGLLYWAFRPAALRVELGAVTRGPLTITVDAEGETRVRTRYVVAAPVNGRLVRLTLDEGDTVARGQVVATVTPAPLDPRARDEARARLESARDAHRMAQEAVAQARAALDQARRASARADSLAARRVESAAAREDAATLVVTRSKELAAAEFRADAAGHEVEAARAALLSAGDGGGGPAVRLAAPVSGTVLRVIEESERVVAAGTPVLEIGDPRRLEVVADLLSTDAVKVAAGDTVLLENWGGDHPLRAVLRRVEPSGFTKVSALGVEEQRVNVVADFVDPPGPLGDRFRVDVRIVVWQGRDVLQVPTSALFRRAGAWHLFVAHGGRARLRPVEVGESGPLATQVLRGVNPGEAVILHPSDRVDDGVRISAP